MVEVEIDEAGRIPQCFDDLVVRLRRHDHEHAKYQRDQQPRGPRPQHRRQRVFAEHEPGRHPRDQEQQRQPPRIEHQHQGFQRGNPMRAFDVKSPGNVEHADVVEDQKPEGADPYPVKVDTAFSSSVESRLM